MSTSMTLINTIENRGIMYYTDYYYTT